MIGEGTSVIKLNGDDLEAGKQEEAGEVKTAPGRFRRCSAGLSWKMAAICFLSGAAVILLFCVVPLVLQRRAGGTKLKPE